MATTKAGRRFGLRYLNSQGYEHSSTALGAYPVYVHGWNVGVKVTPRVGPDGEDHMVITITGGKRGKPDTQELVIGTVRESADGPQLVLASGVIDITQLVK